MIKILGFIDILAAILSFLLAFQLPMPQNLVVFFAAYLFIKGLFFLCTKDFISVLDIASGVLIYLTTLTVIPKTILALVGFFLLQKGFFSLLAN